jgi:hypothetical protein
MMKFVPVYTSIETLSPDGESGFKRLDTMEALALNNFTERKFWDSSLDIPALS